MIFLLVMQSSVSRPVLSLVCLLCLAGVAACSSGGNSDGGFDAAAIEAMRSEKDEAFASEEFSPIPEAQRAQFKGLSYFKPSADYYVEATFEAAAQPPLLELQTSKSNDVRKYERAGEFHFTVNNTACSLAAYQRPDGPHRSLFFVPFLDKTSGAETYAAGRYLDIEQQDHSDVYTLDFNLAYNPYCAYNERYSCPLVPEENTLSVAVEAGEKYVEDGKMH